MSVFDRLRRLGAARDEVAARRAELRGDLSRAAQLWAEADRPGEAARVMLLRGDGESDARQRLQHYTQAVAMAPEGQEVRRVARKKRAQLVITMASGGAISAALRQDVRDAAADLEALGDPTDLARAAEAFAMVGDVEGEARALTAAGDVDGLEELLTRAHVRDRGARRVSDAGSEISMLVSSGRRREALALADALAREHPGDASIAERLQSIRARIVRGPVVRLLLRGQKVQLVVGPEVVIGRTEGSLTVASQAVSRRHLRLARDAAGGVLVHDLGSRNGTELRGMRVAGALPIGDGLDLRLGGEVPLRLAPSESVTGAVDVELAGARYVAPLGPAPLGIGSWCIEPSPDGWLELVTGAGPSAHAAGLLLVERVTLLAGDAIADARGAEPVLRVLGGS